MYMSDAVQHGAYSFTDPQKIYDLLDALTGSYFSFLEKMNIIVEFQSP